MAKYEFQRSRGTHGFGGEVWGEEFAKTDATGRFELDQLTDDMNYMFVIETTDQSRAIVHDIRAGRTDIVIHMPPRADLRINAVRNADGIWRDGEQPYASVRITMTAAKPESFSHEFSTNFPFKIDDIGVTAEFRGIPIDLNPDAGLQYIGVTLGNSNWSQRVPINLTGETLVEFELPKNQRAEDSRQVDVEVKYPHCILDVEDLKTRPLSDVVAAFNRDALQSPNGCLQPPITEKETFDAIATSLTDAHVSDAFKAVLKEITESRQLPPNVYFRRFTRFDDEQQMHEVWWVRLVVESEEGRVYSVPVRTTAMKSRPYTQMERQQNASGGLTLINRFVSYFAEPPNILLAKEFPKDAVDRLVNSAETSIKAKNTEAFQSLFDWNGVSDETRAFVKSEFAMLADSTIHSVKVTPRNFGGELVHWSAYQH